MKKSVLKQLSFILVFVQLFALMAVAVGAEPTEAATTQAEQPQNTPDTEKYTAPSMNAAQTTVRSIKIDGKVNENDVWDQVEWSTEAVPYMKNPIAQKEDPAYNPIYAGYGFKFKVLWAKDGEKAYVYFLIDVNDKNMTSQKRAWACDNIRVFLNEDGLAESKTEAKRNRGGVYASSEFMSYATTENSTGYKYRASKKTDASGYIIEVQYTFADSALAKEGTKMKVNVVGNDADSGQDDGNHFSQQFAWGWNHTIWDDYRKIDYIDHAGTVTLSSKMVQSEPTTTEKPAATTEKPALTTDKPAVTTEKPAVTTEKPAVTTETSEKSEKKGCQSSVGLSFMLAVAFAGIVLTKRKKED